MLQALEAIGHRPAFGLNFDPSHFIWQDLDPVMFLQDFADHILHVHVKESVRQLDGRNGRLGSHLAWAGAHDLRDVPVTGHAAGRHQLHGAQHLLHQQVIGHARLIRSCSPWRRLPG